MLLQIITTAETRPAHYSLSSFSGGMSSCCGLFGCPEQCLRQARRALPSTCRRSRQQGGRESTAGLTRRGARPAAWNEPMKGETSALSLYNRIPLGRPVARFVRVFLLGPQPVFSWSAGNINIISTCPSPSPNATGERINAKPQRTRRELHYDQARPTDRQ